MPNQRRFFQYPRLWGLLSGLTLRLLLAIAIVLQVSLPEVKPVYAADHSNKPIFSAEKAFSNAASGRVPAAVENAGHPLDAALSERSWLYADTPGCPFVGCPPPPTYPAPEILHLSQGGLYGATAAQTASLRNIENQAIDTVLKLHSLPASDGDAVRTWGRDDVLAQIYLALVTAIKTSAGSRTVDQQNAVDWVTEVAKRRTVSAAVHAAREYVKWAALGRSKFDMLMFSNPTKAQIEAFLSGPVLNYDLPTAATEGWCAYRSPAPYGDEYKGYQVPTCTSPVIAIFLPPTPTYDDFVKWGTAQANYPLLSTGEYLSRAQTLGISLGVLLPLAAIIAGYVPYSVAAAAVASEVAFNAIGASAEFTTVFGATTSFLIGTGLALVSTILVAVTAAVILGINVTDAANLPGKLATLIETARNSPPPDAAGLVSSTDGSSNFLSIFIAATTPTPALESCDNRGMQPSMVELTVNNYTRLTAFTPCLNPTAIPAASATDIQFVVKAKSTGVEALSPSITFKNATTGKVTSARLIQKWFVATTNGQTVQSLRLNYTDWNNKQQHAWLIGDITTGYTLLIFNSSVSSGSTFSPETCITDGSCAVTPTIQYIGGDGQHYSATLRPYQPPTGTPIVTNGAEGSPLTLKANNFAPGGAVNPVTYQWNFLDSCPLGTCKTLSTMTGETVSYTWQSPGTGLVDLVATDKVGAKATTRLQVTISSLPPTLTFGPTCGGTMTATCNTWQGATGSNQATLRATIGHAGTEDNLRIDVNWGDGTVSTGFVSNGGQRYFGDPILFTTASPVAYNMESVHVYPNNGIYTGTVTVRNLLGLDGDGGTVVRPFSIKVGAAYPVVVWGNGPTAPAGLQAVTVAGGRWHGLALKSDGTVVAWGCDGGNNFGQCTLPAGLSGAKAIGAGPAHSLAVKQDGTVAAWGCGGAYTYGQCTVPASLSDVKAVTGGIHHSLALKNDGTVVAWGCGTGNYGQCTVPAGLNGVVAIVAGGTHSLALKSNGTVVGWGSNGVGERVPPTGLSGVVAITAGSSHSLALKNDGTVVAWGCGGMGNYGQCAVPAGLNGVVAIATGTFHSLALKSNGTVVAWGCGGTGNNYGQCNTTGLTGIVAIGSGTLNGLALAAGGTVSVWGNNALGQLNIPAGLSGVIKIASGHRHTLALKNDGTVVAWGDNAYGQSTVPAGLSGVTAIAAGARHSLALKGDGTVVAWGENSIGQLNIPAGLTNVTAIAAGDFHSLALKNDGTVVAWGSNNAAESTVPAGLNNVTGIGAGWGFSVALKGDGTVVAWGDNTYKQLTVPTGLSGVKAIATGRLHTLALKNDNTVVAWGYTCCNQTRVPAGLTDVVALAGGGYHSLALKSDGTVVSWGDNTQGQRNLPAGLSGVAAISAGQLHTVLLSQLFGFQGGSAAGGVAAASSVADTAALTATVPLTVLQMIEEPPPAVAAAPVIVETTGQSQRLFLPLVVKDANAATSASGADTTAAALPPAAVAAPAVTTTLPVAEPATVTPTQPLSPLAAAAPVTATVAVETAPLVTATVPVSAQVIVTAPAVSETVAITTAQPVTTGTVGAAALDANAPAETAGQSQNLFLPLIANASALAGAALGSPSGLALLALVVLVVVGLVWQRRSRKQ